jgi:hypothetical protein
MRTQPNTGLVAALKTRDWATFAKGYSGPGYIERRYDLRIKSAFERAGGVPSG